MTFQVTSNNFDTILQNSKNYYDLLNSVVMSGSGMCSVITNSFFFESRLTGNPLSQRAQTCYGCLYFFFNFFCYLFEMIEINLLLCLLNNTEIVKCTSLMRT